MQITVTGRHVELPDDVKQYAHEKAVKLEKFYDRIQSIEVIVDSEGDQFSLEMIVSVDGHEDFIAREIGPDAFALIDTTESKLERQLRKHKEILRNRKHPGT